MTVNQDQIASLQSLRQQAKFRPHEASMYPGAPNEAVRLRCEQTINALIDQLLRDLSGKPSERTVLDRFSATLSLLENEDSEERDRALLYLEDIMAILGLESSGGLLDTWRYGFSPHDA